MVDIKRYATAGGTIFVAAAIGFFMQNSDATASRIGQDASSGEVSFVATTQPVQAGVIVPTPVAPVTPTQAVATDQTMIQTPAPTLVAAPDVLVSPDVEAAPLAVADCGVSMTATPAAAAMVTLDLHAPCLANERATIHHEGMMFTIATDTDGKARFDAPALNEQAVFIVAFPNEEGAVATTTVDSMGMYDRVVLQWRGDAGVAIHALEFGADYGTDGHVWSDAPRDVSAVASGSGGFLTKLGVADALQAEVYTFPSGLPRTEGDIDLSVEAEVTARNCGTQVEAQSLQRTASGEKTVLDLVVEMPACDAVGDLIVLNDMVSDITLAQR
ncbi:hypothetical protein [Nereida sp. MMG025]|uniref:hypothetical protein n=1 Tax=Nereida sp. MMG025 TaxID=2909981 RepID=UPI001F27E662|nr:hypothetical protein [Nereida sp. MMG025]MCF6444566.1 hypothetical protein [Nereida sp. MMG025]